MRTKGQWYRPAMLQLKKFFPLFFVVVIVLELSKESISVNMMIGRYYYLGCYLSRTDLLKDSIYVKNVQTCVEYCDQLNFRYTILSMDRCFCAHETNETQKKDPIFCNVRCPGNKALYCGGVGGFDSYYSTEITGPPMYLKIANATENSLLVEWNHLYHDDGKITAFVIKSDVIHSFTTLPFFPQPEFIVQKTERRFELTDLHPATEYNITVSGMCQEAVCGRASLIGVTEVGIPDPIPDEPTILNQTDTTITIEINPIKNNNGPVTKIFVIVQEIDESLTQIFDEELLGSAEQAQENGTPYYITAELKAINTTETFVVGDGNIYGDYNNTPLQIGGHIHVSLGVVSTFNGKTKIRYAIASHEQHTPPGFVYADFERGTASIIALSVTCVVFGVCFVLSVVTYIYLRYRTSQMRNRYSDTHELTQQGVMVDAENNGFVVDEASKGNFKQQLNTIVENLDNSQKLPRNAIRMNIDDIIADGQFGEVITGKLYTGKEANECQVHVISDDMTNEKQTQFLREFSQITRIMPNDKFLYFYGITASVDWFYLIFENQTLTLKKRLVDSRLPPSTNTQRFSAISEECVLQWMYEIAMAMEYLEVNKVFHKHLCSYSVYVPQEDKIKVSLFGPTSYVNDNKKVDISRWLAPEVLRFQNYSSKSDVWSYACIAWECSTLGGTPYANVASQELLARIKNGVRPEQPSFVFNDLYQLFLNCWQLESSDRLDFEDIAFNVRQILTSPRHALSFDRDQNSVAVLPYYLPLLETFN